MGSKQVPIEVARVESMRYAVVDVETTGLYPGGHDRIVELAIVRVAPNLTISDEYATLLNPGRDIGPSWLHGIETRDVLDAPEFLDIAGEIGARLEGALLVGHNVGFDFRFLESEFHRGGIAVPRQPYVDTMPLAVRMGAESRRLKEACISFGIDHPEGHSALGDARATTALFLRCLEHLGPDHVHDWIRGSVRHLDATWPTLATRRDPWPRQYATERRRFEEPYLASLVRGLPASSNVPCDWQPYYGLLDRALEDRRISEEEAVALTDAAVTAGLSANDVERANEEYLEALVRVALRDRILSETERTDIREVAHLLMLESRVDTLIERISEDAALAGEAARTQVPLQGKTVCFTGAMNASIRGERTTRERATQIAAAHGMVVVKGVTKKLDYLVVADPDSLSGKAQKARTYGTRILAESVFWNWMGVDTDG